VTPVNMASFDTWIKQYRPDENTANTSINYYPKGAVIAFLLDAKIRKASGGARSLDTGMQWAMQRYSGEKGYTPEQFYAVMSEAAGHRSQGLVCEDRGIDRRARLHRGARLLRAALPSG
jgi:predicted metalloprotease with PDZ domain